MFRQRSYILRQLSAFNVNFTTSIFKNRNCFQSLHSGVSYLNNESKTIPSSLTEYMQGDKQLNFRILNDIYRKIHFPNISNDEGHLLLQCCGMSTFNSSWNERNKVCQDIYGNLVKHNKLDLNIYNTYIAICTENRTLLNCKTFLENLICERHHQVYKLLFQNVCECGDLDQAFLLLEIMRNENIPVDEYIFNNLVLVHTLKGGIDAAEKVLITMKTAQVLETSQTHLSILQGIVRSKNFSDLKKFLGKYPIRLDEHHLLNIVKELGLNNNLDWLPEMKALFSDLVITREFISNLKNICIHLVYMNQPHSAINIFHYFQQEPEENYGLFILEEMLCSKLDSQDIVSATKYICDNGMDEYIFEKLTRVALKEGYFNIAWELFRHFKELRSHYFWPIFLNAKTVEGEAGIFRVIRQINEMNIRLDVDSLEFYILPFCSHDDIHALIEKFRRAGFTVKAIINPLLRVLLKEGKVRKASEACQLYNGGIGGDKLFHLICTSWINTKSPSVITVLQKFTESARVDDDFIGDFLVSSVQSCTNKKDYLEFLRVLRIIYDNKLKITTTSADILRKTLEKLEETDKELCEEVLDGIDKILEFKLKAEKSYIPHPRDMKIEELEFHLVELIEKGMETRGVLRRLMYLHVGLGNVQRVEELKKQFLDNGYEETLGMKSALMYNYTKSGNIEVAFNYYNELKTLDPEFPIDHYKLIDLTTLFVKEDRISEARSFLESINVRTLEDLGNIQRNCVQLLNAFKDNNEQEKIFHLLVNNGICKINNIMLGPLVKIFLTRGDLEMATSTFINIAEKYKFTPLQFELIREIVQTQNEEMLQKVLDATTKVHGAAATQVTLIAALAEIGEEKILRKLFATTQIPIQKNLMKRCERWITEGKPDALLTLANSCDRLPLELIDIDYIYQCIVKTFAMNNDCAAAVRFYENLLEKDAPINPILENELYKFLRRNKYAMPVSLQMHNKV